MTASDPTKRELWDELVEATAHVFEQPGAQSRDRLRQALDAWLARPTRASEDQP